MSSRGKVLNEAGLQKMARGFSAQPASEEIRLLENDGWAIHQEADGSLVAVHADKELRTESGQIFVRDNVARAARFLEGQLQPDDSTQHAWFREVEVLNDVYCRKISDLSENDLHKALLQVGATSPFYREALNLELKLRQSQGLVLPQYRKWRIEAGSLTTVDLTGMVKRANRERHAQSPKLQALRDELNTRLRVAIYEEGVYTEDEETEIHQFDEPFVNARLVIRNTTVEVGWIYGYYWQRGGQFIRKPLTAGETFATREAALFRAVEMVQQENAAELDYEDEVQRAGAAKLFAWAGSLVETGMIVDSTSQQSHFDYDSLDADTRQYARHATTKIRSLFRRTLEDVIAIGIELKEMKRRLKGQYSLWLEAEFPMSQRFARRCMGVVDAGITLDGGFEKVPITLIYELASESTPQEARKEIARRAQSGETITRKTVDQVIRERTTVKQPVLTGEVREISAIMAETQVEEISAIMAETERPAPNAGQIVEASAAINADHTLECQAAFNAGEFTNQPAAPGADQSPSEPAALNAGQSDNPPAINAGENDDYLASLLRQQDVFISYSLFKDSPDKIKVAVRFDDPHAPASFEVISFAELGELPPRVQQMIVDKQETQERFAEQEVLI